MNGYYLHCLNPIYNIVFNMTSATADISTYPVFGSVRLIRCHTPLPSLYLSSRYKGAFYTASGMDLSPVGRHSSSCLTFLIPCFILFPYPPGNILLMYTVNERLIVTVIRHCRPIIGSVFSGPNLAPEEGKNPVFSITPDNEAYLQLLINH